ncbi:MAG: HAMP domain-containing sensor histidine kinase [Caulobacteraceae bacterium]
MQTALFLVAFAVAGVTAVVVIRRAEARAAHAEIEEAEDDVVDLLARHGVPGVVRWLGGRHRDPGREIRLEDASGHLLAGTLPRPPQPSPPPRKLWSTFVVRDASPPYRVRERVMAFTRDEPGGLRLTVAENLDLKARQDDALLVAMIAAAGVAAGLGMLGGVLAGGRVLRRVDVMAQVVEGYAAGNREARIPLSRRTTSELDDLAEALNRMMERENRLVEGLRQVSSSIAHDLRRPLAHHNQEIAEALRGPATVEGYRAALVGASARVDDALKTFQALLHIAELEAGAPGLQLEPVDLDALGARVVQAYAPMAEAAGRTLDFVSAGEAVLIMGEPRVLGRMVANLVENALTHTAEGVRVEVRVEAAGPRLSVSDNGAGVPEGARGRLFERFFRLDASRSTPGSGLGLALAAAVAKAFGGELSAHDAAPGLRIIADFSQAARKGEAAVERANRGRPLSEPPTRSL